MDSKPYTIEMQDTAGGFILRRKWEQGSITKVFKSEFAMLDYIIKELEGERNAAESPSDKGTN